MMDNQTQIRRRPVIRVFVSSTFTDLKHERDALQRDVFPKLEQLCASRQFQFQPLICAGVSRLKPVSTTAPCGSALRNCGVRKRFHRNPTS